MSQPQRDEGGKFASRVSRETYLDLLDERGPLGTTEVEEAVGAPYDTVYSALRRLEDDGAVTLRKVGHANLWDTTE